MKLKFQYSEEEKRAILEQHNLFKKVLQSKVTRLMVNEQATPTSGGGVEFLKAARDKGCKIAKGGVLRSAPGKPTVLYKKADYDSDQGYFKIGDELYIKDTFGVTAQQLALWQALCGDSSDNIPGIKGIGPKTATYIINNMKNIESIQTEFPKYDFSKLNIMLNLTTLRKDINIHKSINSL